MTSLVSANGKAFKSALDNWALKAADKLDGLTRQCCQELSEKVVVDTPVDTGFLRGSWQPSIGEPAVKSGAPTDPSGSAALSEISLTISNVKAGDHFFLINNAAYARRIEYGFVGTDSLGRKYNQAGRFYITNNVKKWRYIVTKIAKQLGMK